MNQRLYFLFPDQQHALAGRGFSVKGLPESNRHQRDDFASQIEFRGWRANLALFFLAALALALLIVLQAGPGHCCR